jgi:5-methylthioadenosine/S-adenosylhomocysteine deaminase
MTLFRGFLEDMVLQDWLGKVWKYEFSVLNEKAVRAGSKLALAEMIKCGITCAHDMYWHFEQTMEVAEEYGFRLLSGPPITGLGGQDFDEMFGQARQTLAWLDSLEFVYPIIQAHSTYTTTPQMMHTVREFKEEYGITFTTHASENQAEVESVLERYKLTPIHLLASYGLLDAQTLLAHCVVLDNKEIELLAETSTHVVHCPESNLKLGSGIAPIAVMLEKGINVCIGTDGAASNNDLDILGELRTAALLQKGSNHNPELLTTMQVLEMGTIKGAKAYRLEKDLGSLEEGKKADLVIINLDKPHLTPVHDPAANLIYSSGKSDVETVFINGKLQLESGQLVIIDEEQIKAEVRSISTQFV